MEQIRALELKISTLNDKIAEAMHRSVEIQQQTVDEPDSGKNNVVKEVIGVLSTSQLQKKLEQSGFVQADETLGWKLSFIDGPFDASKLFTPKQSQAPPQL